MTTLINLTPHALTLLGSQPKEIPPSGVVLRAEQTEESTGTIDGVPVYRVTTGKPTPDFEYLPGWEDDAVYIVSAMAAAAVAEFWPAEVAGRFFSPGHLVRDEEGRVVGAAALIAAV